MPTTDSVNTTTTITALPMLIGDRTLARKGTRRGMKAATNLHLEEVRDHLRVLRDKQAPRDEERSFSQFHLDFKGGRITGQFLDRATGVAEEMLIHENAYSQMANNLLPGRGGSFLLAQAALDENGAKLSSMSWANFSRHEERPRLFRTIDMNDNGTTRRVVRSQHSQGYATYDNLDFVQNLLDTAPELAQMNVLQFDLSDTGMRLRFGGEIQELRTPVPMVEAWNSEVGRRRTGLLGGMFRLICTNGAGSWDKKSEFHWRHYGATERISAGVRSAMTEIQTAGSGIVEAYTRSLDIAIDDALAWMEQELGLAGASNAQVARARTAFTDPTTTSGGLLASVVDAVTLAAQDEPSLFDQAEMEAYGSRILRRGLGQQQRGRILIEA